MRRASWEIIRADRGATALVVLTTCLASFAGLGAPWLIGRIVNHVESGTADPTTVDLLAVAIVAFAVAHMVLTRFARYFAHRFAERSLARLREEFVDRTLALPTSVVERAGTGDLMSRTTARRRHGRRRAARRGTRGVHGHAAGDVRSSARSSWLSPPLALCALVGVSGLWWAGRWYLKRARAAYLAEGAASSDLSESIAATVDGARTIEAFDLRDRRDRRRATRAVGEGYRTKVRTLFLRCVLFPMVDFSSIAAMVAVLLAGGVLYVTRPGQPRRGDLGRACTRCSWSTPSTGCSCGWRQVQRSGASLARIKGVGEVEPAPVGDRDARATTGSRSTACGTPTAAAGTCCTASTCPCGRGSGSRSSARPAPGSPRSGDCWPGWTCRGQGHITVGGAPVALLSPEELRRRIVLVTQEHHVFIGTVRDNLAIAAPDAGRRRRCSRHWPRWTRPGCGDLPDGLDTELGANAVTLDAPQAQQLALARVVLADPHTVILDEATALLDPATARHAERAMAAVLAGRTVIAIAHRLHTAHYADRVAVMAGGRITELGSHDELVAAGGEYAALWRHWHGD